MELRVKFRTCKFKSLCRSGPLKREVQKLTYYKLDFYASSAPLNFSDIDACNFMTVCSFSVILQPSAADRKLWRAYYGSLLGLFKALRKRDYRLQHVCPSTWNIWTPTGRILLDWYLRTVWKSVEKIEVWLQSNKNTGYFMWRLMFIHDNISLNSSQNDKCYRQKL
jgi:hypothetical protein